MAKAYDFFSGTQEDINRRLLRKIERLEAKGGDISKLEEDVSTLKLLVGDVNKGLVKDMGDLKITVGDSNSGLVHDFNNTYTTVAILDGIVGQTDSDPNTVLGQLKTIFLDIGNDNLSTSIKGRIYKLEHPSENNE